MKRVFLTIFSALTIVACKNSQTKSVLISSNTDSATSMNHLIQPSSAIHSDFKERISFEWLLEFPYDSGYVGDITCTDVSIFINRENREKIFIGRFFSPMEEYGYENKNNLWEKTYPNTISHLSGWWGGAGDDIFLIQQSDTSYLIKWVSVDEGSGIFEYDYKVLIAPEDKKKSAYLSPAKFPQIQFHDHLVDDDDKDNACPDDSLFLCISRGLTNDEFMPIKKMKGYKSNKTRLGNNFDSIGKTYIYCNDVLRDSVVVSKLSKELYKISIYEVDFKGKNQKITTKNLIIPADTSKRCYFK